MEMANLFALARLHAVQIGILSIVALIGVRMTTRRIPHLAHALLIVVLLKCLIPPVWSSQFGIFCWFAQPDQIVATAPIDSPSLNVRQSALFLDRIEPIVFDSNDEGSSKLDREDAPLVTPSATPVRSVPTEWTRAHTLAALASAWIAVSSMICLGAIVRAYLCIRSIRRDGPVENESIRQRVMELSKKLKLRRRVRVFVTNGRVGPAVFGLLRPTIVIPNVIVQEQFNHNLDSIIMHELLHIRRGDLWVNLLQTLSKAIWWFHPLVWLVSRSLSRTAELCCDEETIATLGCSPAKYARSLIKVLELKQTLQAVPSFPGIRPVEITAKRLERMMKLRHGCRQRTPIWCWILLASVLAVSLPGATLAWDEASTKKTNVQTDTTKPLAPVVDSQLDGSVVPPTPPVRLSEDELTDHTLVNITTQIATVPAKHIDEIFHGWSLLQIEENEAPVKNQPPNSVNHDGNATEIRGGSKTIIERNEPLKYALLDAVASEKVIENLQKHPNAEIVSSPRVTVQDGQDAMVSVGSHRPFVMSFKNGEPNVKIISEGLDMRCWPNVVQNEAIGMRMDVALTTVLNVNESTFFDQGKQITLQIPEVQRTNLNIELNIPKGKTLLLGGLRRQFNNKDESIIVIVKATAHPTPKEERRDGDDDRLEKHRVSNDQVDATAATRWELTLDECVGFALNNSKIIRPVVQVRQFGQPEISGVSDGKHIVLAPTRDDVSLDDIESSVRGLVSEVAKAYWELYFFYRNLEGAKDGRNTALLTWREVVASNERSDAPKIDKASKSQVQEQYFFFRGRVEEGMRDLMKAERQLRYLMGLALNDGRRIFTKDKPSNEKVSFDWKEILDETLTKNLEIKRQKLRASLAEEDFKSSLEKLNSDADTEKAYQQMGNDAISNQLNRRKSDVIEWLADEDIRSPLGTRAKLAEVKNKELMVARERVKLEDLQLELTHSLTDAVQNLDASYQIATTTSLQLMSAAHQVVALKAQLEAGNTTMDFLLDAQRRHADAQVAWFQSTIQHVNSIVEVHFRKGSLLEEFGIELAVSVEEKKAT